MDRQDMIERFVKFLKEYADDEGNQIYLNKIRDILTVIPRRSIGISWEHLNAFDPELAEELLESPEEVILAAEDAIQIILQEEFFRKEPFKIHARFFELPKTYLVKELGSEHINKLIQVEGIITRITEVKPFVSRAVYVCKDCGQEMIRLQKPFATLIKPNKCEACGSRNLELDVDKSTFLNFQSFRLQDRPESLKGGQMPRFVDVILLDDLVDIALPGDRVIITGVMRVVLEQKDKRPIFRKIIEANYIEQLSKEIEELEITPEDEQKIKELAKRKDVVDVIVDSIAPAIYGMKKEKLGIALALFGGTTRQLPDGTRLRGESHVLLVGDPGVAKSQLLRYVSNLAPRAIYTSGKSSSAAGLTAAAVRDELTGSWVLEAGVLVLADMGIALIDEIDKMSDRDRSAIHEALEQQSYHKDFEIFLANGQKVKIGQFVDKLIEENRDNVIIGKDTEILPINDVYLLAYDLEKKEVIKVKADRVSRHKAPKEFIKLRFSNGREIMVTPEHPIMVWEDGGIKEKPAEKIERDDIVIGVVGYSFEGSSEGGKDLALSLFSEKNPFRFKKGIQIPERVFTLKEEELKEFVRVIWERRKCRLNGRECIRIPTRKMAEDLQDILYILGVPTKLREIRPAYSLIPYTTRGIRRLSEILGEKVMSDETEYFPGDIVKELIKSARLIGVRVSINERNKLTRTITKREHVESLLKRVEEKIEDLQKSLKTNPVETLEVLPQSYVYWRYRISKNKLRQLVIKNDPWALRILSSEIETRVEEVRNIVMKVKELMERNILFLKVIRVERVPNTDSEWVYDVTVEPYHLFVSHGLVLHNTVSISKAGITATLNARTTVIAAANPKYGRFNRMKSLPEQLDLPPTLLSRFDLIFVLLDEPDEKFDSEIAEHILKVRKGEAELVAPKVPYDLLKKYIAYARKNVQPILSKEAMEEIKRYYVKMRRTIGRGSESEGIKPIPITARQLEALIRLSEAHARMRLSEVVTKEDAKAAIELVEYTLRRTAMDEEGNIDVSILEVGKSSRKINKMDRVLSIIKELQDLEDYGAPRDEVIKEASRQGISRTETEKIIEELKANSMIYEPRSGYYKVL
ncbi:hypothetical protein EP1X_09300 [Thermococcus sp. EP1]|uniref:intein-containing Cdc46/Mcm family DNA replicative helicase n=1 Tax=Thermococcus sp. EP1 TaxID=1591054 RepID=UPI0006DA67D3|nr:intein-containing Cdc46/Mcm family DNA replicative helicase [Thermococcus sp. EP1]KPU62348.1 hypothetical protein EP1X_09300 [Thermococcus sp. EP1]